MKTIIKLNNKISVEVNPSTKTFKGYDSLEEATKYAEENSSYVGIIYCFKIIDGTRVYEFYGYGVPK